MRIAMLGHKRIPGREGGIEVVVEELAVKMAARGHRVVAYNRWDLFSPTGKAGGRSYRGVTIRQVPTLPMSSVNAFLYSVLACLRLPFGRFDVVHFHAIGSCAMLPIVRPFCRNIVVTVHGLDWKRAKWSRFASRYLLLGEKTAARYADAIIVLSRDNQRYFQQTYQRDTFLIPNGMTLHQPRPARLIREKLGLNQNGYILFLARIVPEKGLHYLLDAFAQLKTTLRLVVAGDLDTASAYGKSVAEQAARDPRVLLSGFVSGELWEELYSNTALYVLPSDVEGMPMSLLEALSFGAPCLVSDIEENIDAARGHAVTFPHSNVPALTEALRACLSQGDRRPVQTELGDWESWDSITDKTLSLYEMLITRKK